MRKAQFKTLEAILAAFFLLSFVAWFLGQAPKLPETESLDAELKILRTLKILDQNNELREYVYTNNTTVIEGKLYTYIPINLYYKVLICENSCIYNVQAGNVYTTSYFLSGDLNNFSNREVLIYAWEK